MSRGNSPGGVIVTGAQIQDGAVDYADLSAAVQALLGQGNRIINGEMRIAQRAATFTGAPNGYQTLDRFGCALSSGSGHTVAQVLDGPAGFRYCHGITVGTGAAPAAGAFNGLWHNIEGHNVADLLYGTASAAYAVLSFYVKASIAGTYSVSFMNGALNRNFIRTYTISAANTWERKTLILPGDIAGTWDYTSGSGLSICWDLGSGTNYDVAPDTWGAGQKYRVAGAVQLVATSGATFRVTGVKLEPGQIVTPYAPRPIGMELALCQRYFEQVGTNGIMVYNQGATGALMDVVFSVAKRATPSLVYVGSMPTAEYTNTPTSVAIDRIQIGRAQLIWTGTGGPAAATCGRMLVGGTMQFSAEL